ncbi:MAG: hypothetical protein RMI43_01585 [Candidatus Caldarchaeum sp.]|nr:hypothetical protein [Candidatus Caldarchaeum sp.]
MKNSFLSLVVLLTLVWALFLIATSFIAFVVLPVIEGSDRGVISSVARTVAGFVVFAGWVVGWQKLTEFWLYRILLKGERE